jgi:Cohesin domain
MNIQRIKFLLLSTIFVVPGLTQASINVSFSPINQAGNIVNVGIVVSGLDTGIAPSLSLYDFDINYDVSHLDFIGATFGDKVLGDQLDLFNSGLNQTTANLTSPGLLNLAEYSLDLVEDLNNLQADSFTLVTLNFSSLKPDVSFLQMAVNVLGDSDGNPLNAQVSASTPVSTVPLPSAFVMLLTGLVSLIIPVTKRNRSLMS